MSEAATATDAERPTRVRCLPGKRLLLLAGLGMVPLIAAPFWWDVLYLVIAFDVTLLAGLAFDYMNLRRHKVVVTRSRSPRLSVGADNPVTLTLENHGRESVRVWVRDGYPGEFEAAGDDIGTNDELVLDRPLRPRLLELGRRRSQHRWIFDEDRDVTAEKEQGKGTEGLRRRLARELTPGGGVGPGVELAPGSRRQVTYMVTPIRRGDYRFDDIQVRVESGLKLATLHMVQPAREVAKVYPNVQSVKQLGLASRLSDLQMLGLKSVRREGGGGEFEKLRDYVAGDSYRDINWKASARRRKPITMVYEAERSQNVVICIDAGRLMASRTGELSKLDHAINAALLLAYTAIKGDDRVGLIVFADGVRTFLAPGKGRAQYRRILQSLYAIESDLCHVDYEAFVTFLLGRVRKRSLVALFTDLHDEHHSRPLVDYTRLLLPRHLPLCVTMADSHLQAVRHQVPEDVDGVFDRAVATELLREREILKSELTRLGAHVIDRPPEDISVDTINAYVDLKRRQLL